MALVSDIRKDEPRAEKEEESEDAFRLTRQVLGNYKQEKTKLYMLQHALTFMENSNIAIRLSAFLQMNSHLSKQE